jgi:uncharacterized membrane protein YhaH (DUF805 family)
MNRTQFSISIIIITVLLVLFLTAGVPQSLVHTGTLVAIVSYFSCLYSRLSDCGWSKWLVILIFIPFVNLGLVIALLITPSKPA